MPKRVSRCDFHVMQVRMFVESLPDAQLLVGSGDAATLNVRAQPGLWCGAALPSCSACAAFVVGISSYPGPLYLSACRADAEDMAWLLHRKGYAVTRLLDPGPEQFCSAFSRFVESLELEATVVIFFSGHGVQVGGVNFLIPLGALQLST